MAVLLVVVAHSGLGQIVPGGTGVTIFFVISGYIITRLILTELTQTSRFDVRGFYIRRLFKIAPPFMLVVFIPGLIYSAMGLGSWAHLAAQLLFVFNWVYLTGRAQVLPGSGVVWSLSIEEQFYLVASLFWLLVAAGRTSMRHIKYGALAVFISGLALRIFLLLAGYGHERTYYGSDTRISAIAAGVFVACVLHEKRDKPFMQARLANLVWLLCLSITLISLLDRNQFFRESFRYTAQEFVTATSIFLLATTANRNKVSKVTARVLGSKVLTNIGLASYSTYLVHFILIMNLTGLVPHSWGLGSRVIFFVSLSLVVGQVIYLVIERPALRWRHKYLRSQS